MKWHQIFFWLLLLFLPTQLGLHFWPQWAMVLGRRVDYLSPTLYLTDILIGLTIFFWLQGYVNRIMNYELRSMEKTKTILTIIHNSRFILLPLGLVAVNIFIAQNHYVALTKWLKIGEFILLGCYIVRTKPSLTTIITPLSIGVLYSSIIAITQFVFQHSVGGPLWWLGERTFSVDTPGIARFESCQLSAVSCQLLLRPYATFPHPNVLGGFLAVVLPLIVLRYLSILGNLRKKRKYFYGSVLAVGVIALFLTFSRSAVVVGTVVIAIAIARSVKHEVRVVGIVLFVFILTSYVLRLTSTEESVVVRQQLNVAAIKLWQTSPLFGVGLGNFLVRLPEALPTRTIYFLQPVHNIYLLLLSEVGVVGFLFSVWFLQKTFRRPFSIWHLAFGILLVLGLVDHYPLTLQQGQLLFTILAAESLASVH